MMKRFVLFVIIMMSGIFCTNSQSIRKNFREMADREKVDLVNAFYELRFGGDLVEDLALFHRDFFNLDAVGDGSGRDIHLNLPDEPERDIFLAWHRSQILEMEHAMQKIYPYISIPFVDWTVDNSAESPLWEENFMGQFNDDWELNRNLGESGNLPDQNDLDQVLSNSSNYLIFSNNLERGVVHGGPHLWTGGRMSGGSSPRDPIFYLHHSFIDYIWQQWQELNGSSSFQSTSMVRYDGTYSFNGQILPLVNPNHIVDSKSLGVFYAKNQFVSMHNYDVLNVNNDVEHFYYQYTIEIKDSFNVKNENKCIVESMDQILIKAGFHAEKGSEFIAQIDLEELNKTNSNIAFINRNQIPFDHLNENEEIVYSIAGQQEYLKQSSLAYPNPFTDYIIIKNINFNKSCHLKLFDLVGNLVVEKKFDNSAKNYLRINDLSKLSSGIYVAQIIVDGNDLITFKVLKQ